MSKTYTTLSREAYSFLCSVIKQVVSLPTDVIDNLNLATNTTYSSIKIKTIVDKTLEDAKEYANEVCAALVKLECRKTTTQPTLENSDINVIYLYSADGNAPFQQYLKISETELVDMGSTNINLDGYLTATEITRDYVTKLDFDSLKTEVERKVNKTDIIDNLTSTDTNKPLSANQGKVLKDSKIDKTSIATTISDTPSDGKVASEKAIKTELDKKADMINIQEIKDVDGKTRHLIMDIPSSHSISGKRTRLFISDNSLAIGLQIWGDNNTLEKDFRVPLTDTKNIFMAPKTLTPASTKVNFDNTISNYTIVNGMCYMNFWSINITSDLNTEVILDNLPKSKAPVSFILTDATGSKSVGLGWIDAGSQVIRCNSKLEAGTSVLKGYARFSYPIDINWIPS